MAMSRQKAIERLRTRSKNILEHFGKIAQNPKSDALDHWKSEIRNWIREMEHALPNAGSNTAEAWGKVVNAYKRVLEELP
jgi:hypothetical protein